MTKTVYLANPYGFSNSAKRLLLPPIVTALESLKLEVWEPFARNNQPGLLAATDWAYQVGQRDVADVRKCDAIFAVIDGTPPDEGVMVELGIAVAFGKPVFLFRDDFRRCTDSEQYPLNLMIFVGLPRDSWRDYYYTSVEEIGDPNKALFKWVSGG